MILSVLEPIRFHQGISSLIPGVHAGFSRKPKGKMPNPTLPSGFKATMKYHLLLCPLLLCVGITMDLRQTYRKMRRALSESERQLAAHNVFTQFLNLPFLSEMQSIAVYIAIDGEIDPVEIIQWCWENQKDCYLPRVDSNVQSKTMQFLSYKKNKILKLNKFKIPEPDSAEKMIAVEELDLILLPLVSFDDKGHRLGMGKGYYDATLFDMGPRFRGDDGGGTFLLGLGYEFQQADKLVPHENDVDLDGMLTDQKLILFRR